MLWNASSKIFLVDSFCIKPTMPSPTLSATTNPTETETCAVYPQLNMQVAVSTWWDVDIISFLFQQSNCPHGLASFYLLLATFFLCSIELSFDSMRLFVGKSLFISIVFYMIQYHGDCVYFGFWFLNCLLQFLKRSAVILSAISTEKWLHRIDGAMNVSEGLVKGFWSFTVTKSQLTNTQNVYTAI